jgi:hypothetical protein
MNVLETALYSRLSGGTALTGALGGTAIYNTVVPVNATFPACVFQLQGGGDENITPKRSKSLLYTVKAVSATSAKAAGVIDAEIDTLLHGKPITVTGYTNFWLFRESDISYAEPNGAGGYYWHVGGVYRIRLAQ